jgi:hypothetical protein
MLFSLKQGWEGFRAFRISRLEIIPNSTRLILEPVDGKEVCTPQRGQFVCMRMNVDGFGSIHQNITIGPAVKGPDGHMARIHSSSSLNSLRSDFDRAGEPILAYATSLSTKGSFEGDVAQIPATMVETTQIIANALKEGGILELSVPVGGGAHIDMNESNDRSNPKLGGNSLLRKAILQNKPGVPAEGPTRITAATPLLPVTQKPDTSKGKGLPRMDK